jgi:hypothetical protein
MDQQEIVQVLTMYQEFKIPDLVRIRKHNECAEKNSKHRFNFYNALTKPFYM